MLQATSAPPGSRANSFERLKAQVSALDLVGKLRASTLSQQALMAEDQFIMTEKLKFQLALLHLKKKD